MGKRKASLSQRSRRKAKKSVSTHHIRKTRGGSRSRKKFNARSKVALGGLENIFGSIKKIMADKKSMLMMIFIVVVGLVIAMFNKNLIPLMKENLRRLLGEAYNEDGSAISGYKAQLGRLLGVPAPVAASMPLPEPVADVAEIVTNAEKAASSPSLYQRGMNYMRSRSPSPSPSTPEVTEVLDAPVTA
tara:strand:- start:8565 stop:9128 length:564 start_codon:yes stop_codon:yes gene_type:complete